jgi:major membrane immunogen (membrane-anchored lipoprotein)
MMKKQMVLWVFLAVLYISCTGKSSVLKDGYYTAEAVEFDEHGWKEYVTICVSSKRIGLVEYNAFNASGIIKSWDMNYMRLMNASNDTYPNAYARYYGSQLLSHQNTDEVDCISGATDSYNLFIRLADAALENARQGNTETELVHFDNAQDNVQALIH